MLRTGSIIRPLSQARTSTPRKPRDYNAGWPTKLESPIHHPSLQVVGELRIQASITSVTEVSSSLLLVILVASALLLVHILNLDDCFNTRERRGPARNGRNGLNELLHRRVLLLICLRGVAARYGLAGIISRCVSGRGKRPPWFASVKFSFGRGETECFV
ncbi:hypothetical protein IWX90DRAFT_165774 [Phyllosticta citrichinensis]|uniref:Uncharacterized protein n=1 Tax=Phyllosticta citrichinensis TaxID=1130410 RepID=A0ABR1Y1B4_9PEZI